MIGLYALSDCLEMAAFADGLRAASLPFKWRNHNVFTADQVEDFSMVVVSGLREKGMLIKDCYEAKGVPVVVIDYGYINRVHGVADFETGYWQVGLNRLNWIPPFECPPDRFDVLGVEIVDRKKRGNTVLICGQYSGDPSHGLNDEQMTVWANDSIKIAKGGFPDSLVCWRPHPKMDRDFDVCGYDAKSTGAVNWDDVALLICINSNVGHEALLNGVPVAPRHDAAYNEIIDCAYECPSVEKRKTYFDRLAYAQWTLAEIRQGLAIQFIKQAVERMKYV